MSIHKSDIQTLLAAFSKSHATGSLKAAGNLIPHLVNALVALVEEKTGGPSQPSVIANSTVVNVNLSANAVTVAPKADPLAVIEDVFTTASTTAAQISTVANTVANTTDALAAVVPQSNSAVQVSEAIQAGAHTAVKAAEVAADAVTIVEAAASVKDAVTGIAAAAVIASAASETLSDAAETIAAAQNTIQQTSEAADAIKDDVAKATKRAPKKA